MATTVAGSINVFLVGALAVQLRSSLHFGPAALGFAISLYYLGATVGSVPFGRLAEAVGGARVMRIASLCTCAVLLLIAGAARSWAVLCVLMFAAGMASSAIQPATNLFLARRMPSRRQGLAFGLKHAAVPASVVLAGLAVPGLALTVGWRWAFVVGALLAALAAATVPRPRTTLAERRSQPAARPRPGSTLPLVVLAVGLGFAVFAAASLSSFTVLSAVDAGISHSNAGLLIAMGGAAAVAGRVLAGARADRRGRAHLPVVAGMLTVGACGYGLLAFAAAGRSHLLFTVALLVTFGAGWGWNGLFTFAVVRTHSELPARATAITQVGARAAGAFGPLTFGLVVAHGSYGVAWSIDAAAAAAAAAVILLGRRLLAARVGVQRDLDRVN